MNNNGGNANVDSDRDDFTAEEAAIVDRIGMPPKTEGPLARILEMTVEEVPVVVGDLICWTRVVKPELEPTLPNFVGVVDLEKNEFFISADVPVEFREAFIAHEVRCLHEKSSSGRHGHCRDAVAYELTFVDKGDMKRYLGIRLKLFNDLIDRFKKDGDPDFVREITGARNQFATLYAECDRRYD